MHATLQYISSFDIALLTETRCEQIAGLQSHKQFWLPIEQIGRAGVGVSVLVHPRHAGSSSLWQAHPDVQSLWVRFQGCAFWLDKDLFVASVYISPAGPIRCSAVL